MRFLRWFGFTVKFFMKIEAANDRTSANPARTGPLQPKQTWSGVADPETLGRVVTPANMNIVPPSGPRGSEREARVSIRPKALIATAFSAIGALVCIVAYSYDDSRTIRGIALAAEGLFIVGCALFWRFERPREVRFKGRLPEPPVIHGA